MSQNMLEDSKNGYSYESSNNKIDQISNQYCLNVFTIGIEKQ